MKEIVSYVHGSFNDFLGKEHHITVCGISQTLPTYGGYISVDDEETGDELSYDVDKVLRIGYSICNPNDKYDPELGNVMACNRARGWDCIMLSTSRAGMFNTATVNFLLNDFLNYMKRSPNQFIKGYNDAESKYHERIDLMDDVRKMSDKDLEFIRVLAYTTPESIEYAKKIVKLLDEK